MSQKLQTQFSAPMMIEIEHARLQTPTNFGPLGGDTLVKSGGKFDLHICELGLLVTLKADGTQGLIPMANVKFAVYKK